MNKYYADFHIHIGRTRSGKAVKITGAKSLTFSNIIEHARDHKGLNMIGIIDCHSPEVIVEMNELLESGELTEHPEGGLMYGGLSIIPGSELEINDEHCQGPVHVLCFFRFLKEMTVFSQWLSKHLKNITLSSQRVYVSGKQLQEKVKELGGIFIPAHVFTPFKSLYGKGVQRSLSEIFDPAMIDAIELGLSADTTMADQLNELHTYSYLTNSDAHSLAKIAREYQVIEMENPTFSEWKKALHRSEGRRIAANYGLDPFLGKYHQTVCAGCLAPVEKLNSACETCGHTKVIRGVADRIKEISSGSNDRPDDRPPYIHQVPLEFIPGLGPKKLEKLLGHFGTEMAVLHEVPYEALAQVIPAKEANLIVKARSGRLSLEVGGGGRYGKIKG